MRNFLLLLLFCLSNLPLSALEKIYTIVRNDDGSLRPGQPVLSLTPMENPELALAEYLRFGKATIRTEGNVSFISPVSGEGRIPVLAFHKIGADDRLEISIGRFEALLAFLQQKDFHVISDFQLIDGDFTYAPGGSRPIVLGCDDGSSGVFYYETEDRVKDSPFIEKEGEYVLSRACMVYQLEKYLPLENGKRNFTFFVTFDAIPFRQTGGGYNPGPPYLGMPAVGEKLRYLHEGFYLGNHTLHHYYSEVVGELEYLFELMGYYDVLRSYDVPTEGRSTLAYSYGIGDISSGREETVKNFEYNGTIIAGAFDYNNQFTRPVDSGEVNIYDISRVGVDNGNYKELIEGLSGDSLYINRRAVLVKNRDFPFNLTSLEINEKDQNYILIGE